MRPWTSVPLWFSCWPRVLIQLLFYSTLPSRWIWWIDSSQSLSVKDRVQKRRSWLPRPCKMETGSCCRIAICWNLGWAVLRKSFSNLASKRKPQIPISDCSWPLCLPKHSQWLSYRIPQNLQSNHQEVWRPTSREATSQWLKKSWKRQANLKFGGSFCSLFRSITPSFKKEESSGHSVGIRAMPSMIPILRRPSRCSDCSWSKTKCHGKHWFS